MIQQHRMPSKTWFLSFSWPSLCSDFSDFNFLVTILGSHYLIMIPRLCTFTILRLRRQRERVVSKKLPPSARKPFSQKPQLTCLLLHPGTVLDMVITLALVTGSSQEPRLPWCSPKLLVCMGCVIWYLSENQDTVESQANGYREKTTKLFGKRQNHTYFTKSRSFGGTKYGIGLMSYML